MVTLHREDGDEIRTGPTWSLVSSTTGTPDTRALYISEMLPSYPIDEVSEVASRPGTRSK
jgi:hypothetical protein